MECVRITACRARGNGIMPGSGSKYGGAYNIHNYTHCVVMIVLLMLPWLLTTTADCVLS